MDIYTFYLYSDFNQAYIDNSLLNCERLKPIYKPYFTRVITMTKLSLYLTKYLGSTAVHRLEIRIWTIDNPLYRLKNKLYGDIIILKLFVF